MLEIPVVAAINHLLAQSPWATERLAPFGGKVLRVVLPPWRLNLSLTGTGLLAAVPESCEGFDVELELPVDAPLRALQGRDRLLAATRISGTADLADALSFVFNRLRWDAEEDLSRLLGDIAAHRLASLGRSLFDWQQRTWANLGANLGEYLTQEAPLLARGPDLASVASEIESLRSDLARLDARLAIQR